MFSGCEIEGDITFNSSSADNIRKLVSNTELYYF